MVDHPGGGVTGEMKRTASGKDIFVKDTSAGS